MPKTTARQKPPVEDLHMEAYVAALSQALRQLLRAARQTWGTVPAPKIQAEHCLVLRVDFDMKGFAHEGRKIYVTPKTARGYRKPHLMARAIVRELTFHRDTCERCGEPRIPLWRRLALLRDWRSHRECRSWGKQLTPEEFDSDVALPADPVERVCHPRLARELDELIRCWNKPGRNGTAEVADRLAVEGF